MLNDAEVWVVRHGEAAAKKPGDTYEEDSARALTEDGANEALRAGRALAMLGPAFSAAYHSPRLRTAQTAQLTCSPLSIGLQPVAADALDDRAQWNPHDALALAQSGRAVLLFTHHPQIIGLVAHATGREVTLATGGVIGMHVDNGIGALTHLLQPADIKRILEEGPSLHDSEPEEQPATT